MQKQLPDYYEFLTWYDLSSVLGLYGFVQEMLADGLDLEDYPDIKIYYDILCNNALKDDADIITVEYVVRHAKNKLIRYGLAHSTRDMAMTNKNLFFYWNKRKE